MIPFVTLVAVALLQGWILQTAVALTGDPAPRYGRALGTGIFTLVTYNLSWFTWDWTAGWFKIIAGPFVLDGLGTALAVGLAALVIKRRLSFGFGQALVIAALHLVFSGGAQWVVSRVLQMVAG